VPIYRTVTTCEVFDGSSTSFWHDRWLSAGRLRDLFPLLYTHALAPESLVAHVLREGAEAQLVPRLTRSAASELEKMQELLVTVFTRDGPDICHSALADKNNVLR
jgi:hypothetical protein